jgi:outer membrane receptor for ferrienterochelin and colicins
VSFDNGLDLRFGGSGMLMQRDDLSDQYGSLNRLEYVRADGFVEAEFWPNVAIANSFAKLAMLNIRLYDNYYQRDSNAYNAIQGGWTIGERFENDNIAALEIMGMMEMSPQWILTAGFDASFSSMEKHNITKDLVSVNRQALYVQTEYFTFDRFSVIAGLRSERNSQFGFAVSPKLSGMLHLGNGFRLFAGAGLGYRAPDFTDLYLERDEGGTSALVLGNPDLRPEYALGFNLGLEYSRGAGFFQITPYYTELFNEINREHIVEENLYLTRNTSRSMRFGVDSEGRISLPLRLFASAGYSYIFAWDRTDNIELFPQPDHTVKTKFGLDLSEPGIYTYFQLRYFSKFREPARETSKQRFLLDYYFSINLASHFKLNLGVDNILGVIDRIGPDTAQTFYAGLKYTR